ncbi:hypothetical protein NliqN6_1769 [Naganishia liquefaciens]|uniref:F-box domain-containing protein n=1 Tax=Naganishia liquefaciens TaxID=104408 RepID=A0A8H3TQI1_9TREE|nr:hypothetical protein NliqN6_1769 [Naganishia liquefaciens]
MWKSLQTSKAPPASASQPAFASYSPAILQPTPLQPSTSTDTDPLIGPLPASIFARILNHLPVPDIPNVARTCRALAKIVRSDERVWKSRCLSLGLLEGSDLAGKDGSNLLQRKQSSRKRQPSLTSAPINLQDDDFGDFASQPLSFMGHQVGGNRQNAGEGEFEDVFGEFTSPAATIKASTKAGQTSGISLMDLEFEDGPHVPLPSTVASRTTPQKPSQQQARTSGFFALNPAVLNKAGSSSRSNGISRTNQFYEIYKSKHEQLTPYITVLRSCSTANSSTLTSTISASQALSLLFPPTQNGPTPLDAQAYILVDLLRYLSASIEPTRDWGWLRRVLGGVCDRFEAVCLSAFDRAESATAVSMTRPQTAGSGNATTDALRLVSEASWNVYRNTRETSPREKRYRSRAKEPPKTGHAVPTSSTVTIVQDLLDDQVEWELGRAWIEKREIFYEGAKWEPGKNIVKIANSQTKQTHRLDFTPMNDFISHVLAAIERDGAEMKAVFPGLAGLTVVYKFAERLANDVIAEYINPLLSQCRLLSQELFLTATAATFVEAWRIVEQMSVLASSLLAEDGPGIGAKIPQEYSRLLGQVVYDMFEVNMDEYLEEEVEYIKNGLNAICATWETQTGSSGTASKSEARRTFLSSSNPDQMKRNVLAGFRDVLLLPVTIVPLTVSYGVNAIVTGGTQAVNGLSMLNPQKWAGHGNAAASAVAEVSPEASQVENENAQGDTETAVQPTSFLQPVDASQPWDTQEVDVLAKLDSLETSNSSPSTADARFSQMQLLLSLDIILELIHADRECLKRIETFKNYTGKYGRKVKDAIEEVFVLLLQAVGNRHIAPGFRMAITQMGTYKPSEGDDATSVDPLLQFFELVHIGDTIQSMIQVYFDKELSSYIDKTDFLNGAMQEKKRFESTLDESVASGLNAGIEVLMNQVDHIIQTETLPGQYCPPAGEDLELGPTKSCQDVIKCLEMHCSLLKGSASKEVLEVFYQEVGIRLQGILQRHIKRQIISLEGGFKMIADLNAYYAFVASLKQPRITEDFSNLKMIGHVYIVADAQDLAQIVKDVARYGATFRPEDVYEFIQRRSDWKRIEKVVDKAMYSLSVKEDCVIM